MNVEYFSKAEKYDLYSILGCEYKVNLILKIIRIVKKK